MKILRAENDGVVFEAKPAPRAGVLEDPQAQDLANHVAREMGCTVTENYSDFESVRWTTTYVFNRRLTPDEMAEIERRWA